MRRCGVHILATLLIASSALAQPVVDEDALPDGAIARLGSMQRRWRAVHAYAFVDHDATLLTVHQGPRLFYRDVASGRLLKMRPLGSQGFDAASISADGQTLAIERRGTLQLWDVTTGKVIREIPLHEEVRKEPCRFRLSADGQTLVTAVGGRLDCWDVQAGRQRAFVRQPQEFNSLSLGLGDQCVLAGDKTSLRCWDVTSGQIMWGLEGDPGRQEPIVLPGGKQAWLSVLGDEATPGLYDLKTGGRVNPQPEWTDTVRWKCLAPDGKTVLIHTLDENLLRDLGRDNTIAEVAEMKEPLAFTPDSRSLIGRDRNYCIQRWSVATGEPAYTPLAAPAHLDVTALAFRADSRTLVSGSEDGGLFRLWDLGTRQPKDLLQIRESSFLHTLTLFPDARRLMHKGKDPSLEIWDLDSAKMTVSFDTPRPFGYKRLQSQASPDGQSLYTLFPAWENGGPTFGLQVWDLKTGEPKMDRSEPTLGGALAFSPDASLFASAATGVHDTATGRLRAGITVVEGTVQRLVFSPDQSRLAAVIASPTKKGGVWLFETGTGWLVTRLATGITGAIAFAPDSRRIVTASTDAIQVWDSFTGRELKRWPLANRVQDVGERLPVASALAVSPDGRTLASGHDDGTILLWPMPPIARESPAATPNVDRIWANLAAADAGIAWHDLGQLAATFKDSPSLLASRLKPLTPPPADRLQSLTADLAAPQFARREAAVRELANFSDVIGDTLKAALAKSTSPEQTQRLRQILDMPFTIRDPDRVRRWRAIAMLEQIGSPEARKYLELIASGPPATIEVETAKSALRRLEKK
jgi:WD40 repeat protein